MKKLLLVLPLIFVGASNLNAGQQVLNGQTVTIPDRIIVVNDLNEPVVIRDSEGSDKTYNPGQSAEFNTRNFGQGNQLQIKNRNNQAIGLLTWRNYSPNSLVRERSDTFKYKVSDIVRQNKVPAPGGYTEPSK